MSGLEGDVISGIKGRWRNERDSELFPPCVLIENLQFGARDRFADKGLNIFVGVCYQQGP